LQGQGQGREFHSRSRVEKLSTTVMSWQRYAWGVLLCASAFAAVAKGWEHGWDTPTDFWWGDFGEGPQLTACMLQCACSSGSSHTRTTHALHGCAHSVYACCMSCVDWVWGKTRAMVSPSAPRWHVATTASIGAAAAVLHVATHASKALCPPCLLAPTLDLLVQFNSSSKFLMHFQHARVCMHGSDGIGKERRGCAMVGRGIHWRQVKQRG
jgi:hypothetical protein